jgi:hypothetical protein
MKSIIITGCLVLSAVVLKAQDRYLKEFRNKYRDAAETHTVTLGSFAMQLAGCCVKVKTETGDAGKARLAKHALKNIDRMKIYTISNPRGNTIDPRDVDDLKSNLERNENFELLLEARDKNSQVQILNKGKGDELGNVVMLVQDDEDFVMINLHTTLKISEVSSLVHQFASN